MADIQLGKSEENFAKIVWEREPVSSTELVRLAQEQLGWQKSTTYTVLKRLCEKGILQNDGGTVTAKMTREEFDTARCRAFIDEAFGGSLPAFLAAFVSGKALTEEEREGLNAIVRRMEDDRDA